MLSGAELPLAAPESLPPPEDWPDAEEPHFTLEDPDAELVSAPTFAPGWSQSTLRDPVGCGIVCGVAEPPPDAPDEPEDGD